MSYFAGFNHYVVQGYNERLRREMSALRLEKRLRENRKPRSTRPALRLLAQKAAYAAAPRVKRTEDVGAESTTRASP